jgi:hypothetical protein
MQEEYFEAIRRTLSAERFESYRRRGASNEETLANYLWNAALCEALYPVLQGLEVSLRNAIFDAGAACFGSLASRDVPRCWLDADPAVVLPTEARRVADAKRRLRESGKPLEPGRVVAELSFGFWTTMFDRRYETSKVLWPRLFKHGIFPAAPRRFRTRKALSPMLNRVRMLRNRAFHHEPIWHWRDLREQHDTALTLVGWLGPELRTTIEPLDRFARVHGGGPGAIRRWLRGAAPFPYPSLRAPGEGSASPAHIVLPVYTFAPEPAPPLA